MDDLPQQHKDRENRQFIFKFEVIHMNNRNKLSLAKYHPIYFNDLERYPRMNPIFIAIDWQGVNFIRRHRGNCLLCDKPSEYYDLSFCYQREVWVLYSSQTSYLPAMKLARNIQLSGASKVLGLLIATNFRG